MEIAALVTVGSWFLLAGIAAAAGPLRISRCMPLTASGSYVLVHDLVTTGGDCLQVRRDSITIDLGGFAINGSDTGGGITDEGNARQNITIRNGTIANFANGIDLSAAAGSSRITVTDLRVLSNSVIGIRVGDFSTVRDNLVADNGWDGIQCAGNSTVTGNASRSNGHDGIYVGFGSTVTGNTVRGNSDDGLDVESGCTVFDNTATGNGSDGIEADAGTTLTTNTTWNNAAAGLAVACPANLIGNTATGNASNLSLTGSGCNAEHNLAP
jgi:putative cofactor-binding repeat protein